MDSDKNKYDRNCRGNGTYGTLQCMALRLGSVLLPIGSIYYTSGIKSIEFMDIISHSYLLVLTTNTCENPQHRENGCGITQVHDFRYRTRTCIPRDLDTTGLPIPVLFPRYKISYLIIMI